MKVHVRHTIYNGYPPQVLHAIFAVFSTTLYKAVHSPVYSFIR